MSQSKWRGEEGVDLGLSFEQLSVKIRQSVHERSGQADTRNFYELIGVSSNASVDEIKEACLSIAERCRPDKHGGDMLAEQAFSKIERVFETLTDPRRRAEYDETLPR